MVREARQAAGLSMRALADRAGTSASTVARVEAGTMDPTTGMLRRLMRAAGRDVVLSSRPSAPPPRLADLRQAWTTGPAGDRPDWTRLRAMLDHLARHPEEVARAVRPAPRQSGSAVQDALLAAIADKLSDDHGLARPAWTAAAQRRLPDLWESPGTPAMRLRARRSAPPQFLEHGLAISSDSLWRATERSRV